VDQAESPILAAATDHLEYTRVRQSSSLAKPEPRQIGGVMTSPLPKIPV
jgi:hypothetical protein